jgi:hypothetical protein
VVFCAAADVMCVWTGMRKDLPVHIEKCPYFQLRPVLLHFQAEVALLKQQVAAFPSRSQLEGDIVSSLHQASKQYIDCGLEGLRQQSAQFVNTTQKKIEDINLQLYANNVITSSLSDKLTCAAETLTSGVSVDWSVDWLQTVPNAVKPTSYFQGYVMCGEIPGNTQHKLSQISVLKAVVPSYNTEVNSKQAYAPQKDISKQWLPAASAILSSINTTKTYHQDLAILQEILNGIYIAMQDNSKNTSYNDITNPMTAQQIQHNHNQIWSATNTYNTDFRMQPYRENNQQTTWPCENNKQAQQLLNETLKCLEKKITQAQTQFKILHSKHLSPAAACVFVQYLHSGGLKWLVAMADNNYKGYLKTCYTEKISSVFRNTPQRYNSAIKLEMTKALLMIVSNHIFVYNSIFKYTATGNNNNYF